MVTKLDGGKAAPTPTAPATDLVAQMEAAKQKLKAIQSRIADTGEYSRYLSLEDQTKAATTGELAGAQIDMLDSYIDMLKNGTWDANAAAKVDPKVVQDAAATMANGWNDMSGPTSLFDETKNSDGSKKSKIDPAIAALGSQYMGTVMLENSGSFDPASTLASNSLFFVTADDVQSVTGRTVGTDIQMQVVTKSGEIKVYVLKNMAVRPEPIYIYAGNKKEAITIDMSRVARIADGNWGQPFGTTNGLMIFGGTAGDTLIGSAGNDVIVGGAGDDKLYGLGGIDEMYGDNYNVDGAAGFQTTDGNDLIDGGAGKDIIRAGGGAQDTVWNAETDGSVSEQENKGMGVHYSSSAGSTAVSQLISGTSPQTTIAPDGTVIVDYNGSDGLIKMPTGYNMASAEMDSTDQSLMITMTKTNTSNGVPETIHIRVRNFFDSANTGTLIFQGNADHNMIDFSDVALGSQHIQFEGGSGDDIILSPKSQLDNMGLSIQELTTSTATEAELKQLLNGLTHKYGDTKYQRWGLEDFGDPTSTDPSNPEHFLQWQQDTKDASTLIDTQTKSITLRLDPVSLAKFNSHNVEHKDLNFNFSKPFGYDKSYLVKSHDYDNGIVDYKLVFVKETPAGPERIVVNLRGIPSTATISSGGIPITIIDGSPVTVVGNTGGSTGANYGYDTVFGSASSLTTKNNDQATVITGTYAAEVGELSFSNQSDHELLLQLKNDLQIEEDNLDIAEQSMQSSQLALKELLEEFTGNVDQRAKELLDIVKQHDTTSWSNAQWVKKLQSYGWSTLPSDDDNQGNFEDISSLLMAYAQDYADKLDADKAIETLKNQISIMEDKFNGA